MAPKSRPPAARTVWRAAALALALFLPLLRHLAAAHPAGARSPAQSALSVGLAQVLGGLAQPVFVTHAGDRSGRLFVVERRGTVRVAAGGRVAAAPFLDLTALVESSGAEQGLLGLAFDPGYATNGLLYVYYTARPGGTSVGDTTVARYRVSADPDRADPASAAVLFSLPDRYANHNGGMLAFGPDGYLYVGTGDGGGGGDPDGNAQAPGSLLGKLLRLDVRGGAAGQPYGIPPSNPFVGRPGARPEVWALGLRNPWRFAFDRETGDLFVADVGQANYEEVNLQRAGSPGGANYGWNRMEGLHCYGAAACDQGGLTLPIAEYDHSRGDCSITGGYVYRGSAVPGLRGAYVYGDYCTGRIWALRRDGGGAWAQTLLLDTPLAVSSFGEDEAGELYVTDLAGGSVYRVVDLAATTATPTAPSTPTRTPSATASPTATATPPAAAATATPSPTPVAPPPAPGGGGGGGGGGDGGGGGGPAPRPPPVPAGSAPAAGAPAAVEVAGASAVAWRETGDGRLLIRAPGRAAPVAVEVGTVPHAPDEWCRRDRVYRDHIRLEDVGVAGATFGVEAGGALAWVPPEDAGCVDWARLDAGRNFPKEVIMQFRLLRPPPGALLWVLDGDAAWRGRLYEVGADGAARYVTPAYWAANQAHFREVWKNVVPTSQAQLVDLQRQGHVGPDLDGGGAPPPAPPAPSAPTSAAGEPPDEGAGPHGGDGGAGDEPEPIP